MAKSLDELIEYLLGEIALSGQYGCTPTEIIGFVFTFYHHQTASRNIAHGATPDPAPQEICTVDQAFLDQVWKWLSRHPDVSVGKDSQLSHVSLSQIQSQYLAASTSTHAPENPADDVVTKENNGASHLPRVYVSDDRMWHAICGHGKDTSRVFESEFALLSVIASTRSHGIIQGDLTKATGQDKRSVPKRTDTLQRKGYIEKRAVHARAQRTSRLTLRKFVVADADRPLVQDATDPQVDSMFDEAVDMKKLITGLFEILRERGLVTRNDLKAALGMMTAWRSRILMRMIRQFEALGCLKRCRAASQGSLGRGTSLHPCVKFLHEPTKEDLQHYDISTHADKTLPGPTVAEDEDEGDEPDGGPASVSPPEIDTGTEVERPVPQWNSRRPFTNQLVEIVHKSGMTGIDNNDVASKHSGLLMRRSIDNVLSQMSNQWWQTQPRHLRHMAIIRDAAVTGNRGHYDHYSFPNFAQKVQQGESAWEAVLSLHSSPAKPNQPAKGPSDLLKTLETTVPRDEFGFPVARPPSAQYRGGAASFRDLLDVVKPDGAKASSRPVVAAEVESNRDTPPDENVTRRRSRSGVHSRDTSSTVPDSIRVERPVASPKVGRPGKATGKTRGRPRKFVKGTESFWQDQFWNARAQAHPDTTYTCKGSVMTDESGLALFAQRPADFDATLVRAIEQNLPVPALPQDITPLWVTQTQRVLDRRVEGLYMTPGGKLSSDGHHHRLSQQFILRSSRLREIDLSPTPETSPVRFITSSAAHTFIHRRYYPGPRFSNYDIPSPLDLPLAAASDARDDLRHAPAQQDEGDLFRKAVYLPPSPALTKVLVEKQRTSLFSSAAIRKHTLPHPGVESKRKRGRPRLRPDEDDVEPVPVPVPVPEAAAKVKPRKEPVRRVIASPGAPEQSRKHKLTPPLTTRARRRKTTEVPDDDVEDMPATADAPPQDDAMSSIDGAMAELQTAIKEVQTITAEAVPAREMPGESQDLPRQVLARATTFDDGERNSTDQGPRSVEQSEAYRLVQELTSAEPDHTMAMTGSSLLHRPSSTPGTHDPTPLSDVVENSATERVKRGPQRERPRVKRGGPGIGSGSIALLRRKIILDLVDACSGALPYYTMLVWRAFTTKWQQAGQPTTPDVKTARLAVKNLCESGTLKQITFAFKNRKGVMVTKNILARPGLSITDGPVKEMQQKMIHADPLEYVPPSVAIDPGVSKYKPRYASGAHLPAYSALEIMEEQVETSRVRFAPPTSSHEAPGTKTKDSTKPRKPVVRLERPGDRKVLKANANPPNINQHEARVEDGETLQVEKSISSEMEDPATLFKFWTQPLPKAMKFKPVVEVLEPDEASRSAPRGPVADHVEKLRVRRWKRRGKSPNRPPPPPLPTSLAAFFNYGVKKHSYANDVGRDGPWIRFNMEVDTVAFWEGLHAESFEQTRPEWPFINLQMTHTYDQPGFEQELPISFTPLVEFDIAGNQIFSRAQPPNSHDAGHTEVDDDESQSERPPIKKRKKAAKFALSLTQPIFEFPSGRQRKRKASVLGDPSTQRARSNKSQIQYSTNADGELILHSGTHFGPIKRVRGVQYLRTLPEHFVYRLVVAVIVVRTLAGGLEKAVDWTIVARLFPGETEQFVRDRYTTLRNRYRSDVHALTESFQERYITAYEKGEVPGIVYDDLLGESNDWEAIVAWAVTSLDKRDLVAVEELPTTKQAWLRDHDVALEEERGMRDLLMYNTNATNPKKEEALSGMVSATPISTPANRPPGFNVVIPAETEEATDPELCIAKSYVRATVLTPPTTFDAPTAAAKLSTLAATPTKSEDLLAEAVKSLLRDKIISKHHKDPPTQSGHAGLPGGRFEINQKFLESLDSRRMVHAEMLRQATRYKTDILDPAFSADGPGVVQLDKDGVVLDGQMVCILNLLANHRIRIRIGPDVPKTRYGIDWPRRGYETRLIDKKLLGFSVLLQPMTDKYVFGNPVHDLLPPIPRGEADDPHGRIPCWIDIHGVLQREVWEGCVAAVVGLVSTRVGIDVLEIQRTLGHGLTKWDVELILSWLEVAGLVRRTQKGKGWETQEWWWLA